MCLKGVLAEVILRWYLKRSAYGGEFTLMNLRVCAWCESVQTSWVIRWGMIRAKADQRQPEIRIFLDHLP
jgi:hypothetical protein